MAEALPDARRVRRRWARLPLIFAAVGPGLITAMADNDAGGIATYSLAGAEFGYSLLWTLIPITAALLIVQEMCARMGVVTGKGLADLIRERFGVKPTFYVMLALLIANVGTTMAEFSGVAEALAPFGVPKWASVPVAAASVWLLVLKGNARLVERVFLLASLFYGAYFISGGLAKPDWAEVWRGTFEPTLQLSGPALTMLVTLIGTTITPWMQFFLQSAMVEKGLGADDLGIARADVIVGSVVTDVISFFIIVSCAATIYVHGGHIQSASDAAVALAPFAGKYASLLFSFGLLNASLLAASILPLATTYYVCEAFGWETGLDKRRDDAPQFYFLYEAIIVVGAGLVLIPGLPLLRIMLLSQTANGVLLPFILIFILLLAGDERLMGRYRNGPVLSAVAWTTAGVLIALTGLMLWFSFVQ
jgi:NRAMP (natural resistance-associated macrophage protein)-like metal ion transporter